MTTMKTNVWLIPLALCAGLAGCGGAGSAPPAGQTASDPATQALSAPLPISVRLLGEDAGTYSVMDVSLASLDVEADGVPLTVSNLAHKPMNLANTSQAWLLGTATVPAGTANVRVTITFAGTASWIDAHGAGSLNTAAVPIRYTAPVKFFALQDKTTFHVDLLRSAISGGSARLLLPQGEARF